MRLALIALLLLASPTDWQTFYEKSDYKKTPNYDQTIEYCKRLAEASPWVEYKSFGTSPRGRDLPLLIVDREGRFEPDDVRKSDNVVFMILAGIHSGEINGKDAGLTLIRDIVMDKKHLPLLDHVTILFIPIFNVDGHERSGPYNRANQNGPEQMGWRTTATNLNLNRDFLKADAPEMQAWLRLYNRWLPEFLADCHTTDGADYQYPLTHAVELFGNMDPQLTAWAASRYVAPLEEKVKRAGYPTIRYNWYRTHHEPRSGIVSWAAPPRFSEGYAAIQNRPGILIETHMLKDYKTRVTATYHMLKSTLEILDAEHGALKRLVAEADRRTASPGFRDEPFPLTFRLGEDSVMIDFLGYEYDVETSDLTGGKWHRFSDKPVTMKIPYFFQQIPDKAARLPVAYIVPPEWTDVIERLELHGVRCRRLTTDRTIPVKSYVFENPSWGANPYEGRQTASFTSKEITEARVYPRGSAVVDMEQRAARVAAHALEPDGPDSFVSWGFFNAIFEQKEYIESYVIEDLARKMMATDENLAREFEEAKAADPEMAKDPRAIRRWFYRRTPYWDDRIGVYPVGKIVDRATVEAVLR